MTDRVVIHTQHDRWRVTFHHDQPDPFIEMWDPGAGWVAWERQKDNADSRRLEQRLVDRARAMRL